MTPAERTLRGRIGAYSLHAQGGTNTRPARSAFWARFEREVDPDGILPEAERHKRAEHARRAYFAKLGLKSAQKRQRKRKQKAGNRTDLQIGTGGQLP